MNYAEYKRGNLDILRGKIFHVLPRCIKENILLGTQIEYLDLFTTCFPEVLVHPCYHDHFGKLKRGIITYCSSDTRTSFEIMLDMQNELNVHNSGTFLLMDTINVIQSSNTSLDLIYENFQRSLSILNDIKELDNADKR